MIHLVVRTCDFGKAAGRPSWFSKDLCLWSVARAWSQLGTDERGESWIVHDGRWPDRWQEIASVMRADVDLAPSRGKWFSLGRALGLLDRRDWSPEDTVIFIEDDYLVVQHAFERIATLHRSPELKVTYSSIYAPAMSAKYVEDSSLRRRRRHNIDGREWLENDSTTHTFAANVDVLRTDQWLFRLAVRDPSTPRLLASGFFGSWASRDHATFRALLGDRRVKVVQRLARQAGKVSGLALDVDLLLAGRTVRRLLRRPQMIERTLLIPVEPIATHAEVEYLTAGHDWDTEASSVEQWRTQTNDFQAG